MIKTVIAALVIAFGVLGTGYAVAQPPSTTAPNTADPCLFGEPVDTTVVTPDGAPAAPTTECPVTDHK